jgi:hypothetical protein
MVVDNHFVVLILEGPQEIEDDIHQEDEVNYDIDVVVH